MVSAAMNKLGPATRLGTAKKRTEAIQAKHVPGKLRSQKAKIGSLCGCCHKNLTVMKRRLYFKTAKFGDRHHRHKKMPSIIF